MKSQMTDPSTYALAFLKTTIVGGLVFLLPLVVLIIILGHAMQLAEKVVHPVIKILPNALIGAGLVTLASILALVIVALIAGLLARTKTGKTVVHWLESSFLSNIPQYQFAKSMADGFAQIENASGVTPALVSVEDGWQLGYLLETIGSGWVSVFLPQAPTPMSGNIMYFPADRVRPLDITMVQAMSVVKRLGVGSAEALKSVDLRLPEIREHS